MKRILQFGKILIQGTSAFGLRRSSIGHSRRTRSGRSCSAGRGTTTTQKSMQTEIGGAFAHCDVNTEYFTFRAKLDRPIGSQGRKSTVAGIAKEGFAGGRISTTQFVKQLLVSAIVISAKKTKKIIGSRVDVDRASQLSCQRQHGSRLASSFSLRS